MESVAKTAGKLSKGPEQQPMEVNNMTKVRKEATIYNSQNLLFTFLTHISLEVILLKASEKCVPMVDYRSEKA